MEHLNITRCTSSLVKNNIPWKVMVEKLDDDTLISIVKLCNKEELKNMAYFGITNNKYKFIKMWWNCNNLEQIKSVKDWIEILISLKVYEYKINIENPIEILLAIIKSKNFIKMSKKIIYYKNEENEEKRVRKLELIRMILHIMSGIENGTKLLYKEWKKLGDISELWEDDICLTYIISSENLINKNNIIECELNMKYNYILKICEYGNLEDFKIVIKENWIEKNVENIMLSILKNKNIKIFRYMMEIIWSIKKMSEKYPKYIDKIIWENSYVSKIVTENNIDSILFLIKKEKNKKYYKIKMINWLYPEICTGEIISDYLDKSEILKLDRRLGYCMYNYFCEDKIVASKPEEIIWLEKQIPFISIKISGEYINKLSLDCYPKAWNYYEIKGKRIKIEEIEIYLIYDVNIMGIWKSRIEKYSKEHKYWRGPYLNYKEEQKDLSIFIESSKKLGKKKIWWPIGIYQVKGEEYYKLLSENPETIYKNNGWIISGNTGLNIEINNNEKYIYLFYLNNNWYINDLNNVYIYNHKVNTPKAFFYETTKKFPINNNGRNILDNKYYNLCNYILISILKNTTDKHSKIICLKNMIEISLIYYDKYYNRHTFKNVIQNKLIEFLNDSEAKKYLEKYKFILEDEIIIPEEIMKNITCENNGMWKCYWDKNINKWQPISINLNKTEMSDLETSEIVKNNTISNWNTLDLLNYDYVQQDFHINQELYGLIYDFLLKNNINFNWLITNFTIIGHWFTTNGYILYSTNPNKVTEMRRIYGKKILWIDNNMKYPITNIDINIKTDNIFIQDILNYSTILNKIKFCKTIILLLFYKSNLDLSSTHNLIDEKNFNDIKIQIWKNK